MTDLFAYDDFDDDEFTIRPSERLQVEFFCEDGHKTNVMMSTNAEIPNEWVCETCSKKARLKNSEIPISESEVPKASHWDKILQRRSLDELEVMLQEQIKLIRSGKIAKVHT
ncbi:MAG: RNA polymerase-binding protein RbpA [Candidatus Ancillula sp.]|jgi:hypothetical protein|nr:RNA polymerase-binding protein RbpA [Candidatus Ancillula sp.]